VLIYLKNPRAMMMKIERIPPQGMRSEEA